MNALDHMDDHIRAAAITLSGEEDFKAGKLGTRTPVQSRG